jgi:hypothetical protein
VRNSFTPYKYLALAGLAFLIASFFIPDFIFDFHSSQRFYVMKMDEALRYISTILLALFAVVYFLQRFLFSIVLSWIHVCASFLILTCMTVLTYKAHDPYVPSYSRWPSYEENNFQILNLILWFFLCQSLLLANVVWSLFRKIKPRNTEIANAE